MYESATPMQLLARARRDAIKACYESHSPGDCLGCEDYAECQMSHEDHAWLETLAMLKRMEVTK